MTDTFSPSPAPSIGSRLTVTHRVKKVDFGDGYGQRAQDGINAKVVVLDLVWNALTLAQASVIEAFFDSQSGYKPFYYTFHGDMLRKYTCTGYSRSYDQSGVIVSLSATLEESFAI